MTGRRGIAVLGAVVVLLGGCRSTRDESPPEPVRPMWQAATLPVPPGAPGRLMLRDAAACAGRWYVVGAIGGPDGATRPAAWRSTDGHTWSSLPLHPISYYGERAILYAVGCHQGRISVIGARAGGAHGNPRVRTWRQDAEGGLVEVSAEFEVYGGPEAVSASRIAGGAGGWLIAGARSGGAAVWLSADATDFRLVDRAPALASEPALSTLATDALAVSGGWLVSGAGRPTERADRDPFVWFSADGRGWARVALPSTVDDEIVQRLVQVGPTVYAVGVRGSAFQAWVLDAGAAPSDGARWRVAGRFGATGVGAVAGVEAAAGAGAVLLAMTLGAADHRLWRSDAGGTSWVSVVLPIQAPAGGDTSATVAVLDGRVVIAIDGGTAATLWSAPLEPT
ncbi:hypothetical protein V6V47_25940 [Micromonospora sp. CPCC 205539]|uniref:hypothetical protein n=1 Tax=Micromonospora sp. CPCC 205539 TaxID=3122408 RepID=UPI002FF14198